MCSHPASYACRRRNLSETYSENSRLIRDTLWNKSPFLWQRYGWPIKCGVLHNGPLKTSSLYCFLNNALIVTATTIINYIKRQFSTRKICALVTCRCCKVLSPGQMETQVDASFKIWTCIQTCVGGQTDMQAYSQVHASCYKKPFQCSCACYSKQQNLRWLALLAKWWKTCVYLRANLIVFKVVTSPRKSNLCLLATSFGQGFKSKTGGTCTTGIGARIGLHQSIYYLCEKKIVWRA